MRFGEMLDSIAGLDQPHRFYGKYRGTVINNVDPMQIGRIQALVPDVSASMPTSWAMPCYPATGIMYGVVTLPPLGAGVWIEFEQGDPDYPIWTGGFYGQVGEVPVQLKMGTPVSPPIVLQTVAQNSIAITDVPPMITLKCGASTIIMRPDGVTIAATNITVTGTLVVNAGALTVTP